MHSSIKPNKFTTPFSKPQPMTSLGRDFFPLQAALGGALIGTAVGGYMLLVGRTAGASGALRALLGGRRSGHARDPATVGLVAGLVGGGAAMASALPGAFENPPPSPSPVLAAAGLLVGLGTSLGNGCTSGHGLCGMSRMARRSLAATATFVLAAGATATLRAGTDLGAAAPVVLALPPEVLHLMPRLAAALLAGLVPLHPLLLGRTNPAGQAYAGLWAGGTFASGLALGGMVRPSAVLGALSPARFDGTLWVLFGTALATTFALYRAAERAGWEGARAPGPPFSHPVPAPGVPRVDAPLVAGAALFGMGWGLGGVCPGPHLTTLGARPGAPGPWVMLLAAAAGMSLAPAVERWIRKMAEAAAGGRREDRGD